MAAAGGSSGQEHPSESEEATGKGRKRQRGDFEAKGAGMAKCLPCSWASKAGCLVSLHKKDRVLSVPFGHEKRALTKAQQQQQEAGLPISRICQHEKNVEAWKQHKEQLVLQEQQQAPAIGSWRLEGEAARAHRALQ
eukprot:1155099-Pelagomonas_calceolata.AAC.3